MPVQCEVWTFVAADTVWRLGNTWRCRYNVQFKCRIYCRYMWSLNLSCQYNVRYVGQKCRISLRCRYTTKFIPFMPVQCKVWTFVTADKCDFYDIHVDAGTMCGLNAGMMWSLNLSYQYNVRHWPNVQDMALDAGTMWSLNAGIMWSLVLSCQYNAWPNVQEQCDV